MTITNNSEGECDDDDSDDDRVMFIKQSEVLIWLSYKAYTALYKQILANLLSPFLQHRKRDEKFWLWNSRLDVEVEKTK